MKIDVKIKKCKNFKTLLNCDNKINLISKRLIKKLNVILSFDKHVLIKIIDEKQIQTFDIHFFNLIVYNVVDVVIYFEKSFLKINLQKNVVLNMS